MREMKTKFYLETLILLLIKWTGMVEIKHNKINHIMVSVTDN